MGAPASRRDELGKLIYDMEANVRSLVRWGDLIMSLANSDDQISTETLAFVGNQVFEAAKLVQEDWERSFELSRPDGLGKP